MGLVTSLRYALFGLAPLLVLSWASVGCESKAAKGNTVRPPPLVSVVKLEKRDVDVEVHAPVDLRPLFQAEVGSKTLGYLDAVLVDRGDEVKRGQLVALIRPSDLPDQLAAAKGALAQTQASLGLARTNHQRVSQLAPSGVVSQQELQQAEAALAAATANEAAARAQIGALGDSARRDAHRHPRSTATWCSAGSTRARWSVQAAAAPSSPWRASTCCASSSA